MTDSNTNTNTSTNTNAPAGAASHQFQVQGMTCGHCERAVTDAVQQLDPQASVQIDRAANQVQVRSTQPRAALAAAIAEEGYQVAP